MRNLKKGFSLIQLIVCLILTALIALGLTRIASVMTNTVTMMRSTHDSAESQTYILHTIITGIKNSDNVYEVEEDTIRLYKEDGTHTVIFVQLGQLYIDGEIVAKVSSHMFTDTGEGIRVFITFRDMPAMDITVYRTNTGYTGGAA